MPTPIYYVPGKVPSRSTATSSNRTVVSPTGSPSSPDSQDDMYRFRNISNHQYEVTIPKQASIGFRFEGNSFLVRKVKKNSPLRRHVNVNDRVVLFGGEDPKNLTESEIKATAKDMRPLTIRLQRSVAVQDMPEEQEQDQKQQILINDEGDNTTTNILPTPNRTSPRRKNGIKTSEGVTTSRSDTNHQLPPASSPPGHSALKPSAGLQTQVIINKEAAVDKNGMSLSSTGENRKVRAATDKRFCFRSLTNHDDEYEVDFLKEGTLGIHIEQRRTDPSRYLAGTRVREVLADDLLPYVDINDQLVVVGDTNVDESRISAVSSLISESPRPFTIRFRRAAASAVRGQKDVVIGKDENNYNTNNVNNTNTNISTARSCGDDQNQLRPNDSLGDDSKLPAAFEKGSDTRANCHGAHVVSTSNPAGSKTTEGGLKSPPDRNSNNNNTTGQLCPVLRATLPQLGVEFCMTLGLRSHRDFMKRHRSLYKDLITYRQSCGLPPFEQNFTTTQQMIQQWKGEIEKYIKKAEATSTVVCCSIQQLYPNPKHGHIGIKEQRKQTNTPMLLSPDGIENHGNDKDQKQHTATISSSINSLEENQTVDDSGGSPSFSSSSAPVATNSTIKKPCPVLQAAFSKKKHGLEFCSWLGISYNELLDLKRKPSLKHELNPFRQLKGMSPLKEPQTDIFQFREVVREFLEKNNMPIPHPTQKRASIGTAKKRKELGAPKRPNGPFTFFFTEERNTICPGLSPPEQMRTLGGVWGEMTMKEKAPYNILAENDRQRYNLEVDQFKKKRPRLMSPTEAPEEETMKDVAFQTAIEAAGIPVVNTDEGSPMDKKGMKSGSKNSNVSPSVHLESIRHRGSNFSESIHADSARGTGEVLAKGDRLAAEQVEKQRQAKADAEAKELDLSVSAIETWLKRDVFPDTEEEDIIKYAAVFVALGLDSKAYIVNDLKPEDLDDMEQFRDFKPFHKRRLQRYLQDLQPTSKP